MVNNIFEEVKKNSKLHNLVCLWVDLGSCGSLVHSRMLEWEFLRICCVNSVISLPAWVKGRIKLSPVSIFFFWIVAYCWLSYQKLDLNIISVIYLRLFPLPLSFARFKKNVGILHTDPCLKLSYLWFICSSKNWFFFSIVSWLDSCLSRAHMIADHFMFKGEQSEL